jgi:hypothetical protein
MRAVDSIARVLSRKINTKGREIVNHISRSEPTVPSKLYICPMRAIAAHRSIPQSSINALPIIFSSVCTYIKKYQIPRDAIGSRILNRSLIKFGNSDQLLEIIRITPIPIQITPIIESIFINPIFELSAFMSHKISFFC